ncbi:MAG: hypothetical protein IANPNBLG_00953 [Bryobacteraceae bacterium]|nr:hypothetical protein [Bryobacteraceae bacterium]
MNSPRRGAPRRIFLQQAALAGGAAALPAQTSSATPAAGVAAPAAAAPRIQFPRVFTGRKLAMIAFPLGGIGAGSISLGGRGQLRDWEIFNRPDKGNSPAYAFPAIWARAGNGKPVARVLESRILPPYEGSSGLGFRNVPGLPRLAAAAFTGEYPLAGIEFRDARLPVKVTLEAFSPFIPLDAEESGLPAVVLRYRLRNTANQQVKVSIAWSIENPVGSREQAPARGPAPDSRTNEIRVNGNLAGLVMSNPGLGNEDPLSGDFTLAALVPEGTRPTMLRGWPQGRWWNSPMLFWDDFRADGELGPEPEARNQIGALCLSCTLEPGKETAFPFLLAWRFPNRTPKRCGWTAPKGEADTIIGNHYCRRFASSWDAAAYLGANLERLEETTRKFVSALRGSTLPPAVKDAASANLSTLATTTCFRTADGEFHGFEGVNDHSGCCFGNCTHVWNYETVTNSLFPTLARSLRKASFGYSLDDAGAIHFRQLLPDGKERSGFAAADGQMGQIIKVYDDWRLSGDTDWLRSIWPRVKKALEFAWTPGGWDADRDGVLEGAQHNTYDVEFYGPNPQCGIYYLGALRAGEEMARELGDAAADEYRRLFEHGSKWIDEKLFTGEYYVQQIRGVSRGLIAPALLSSMGSENTEKPAYQVGQGCLVDQLVGQYLAETAGLGQLVDPRHVRKTLESIYRYNYKRNLYDHDTVQRTFALNDEPALVICDYGKAERPRIPFPYYGEVMTGFEYTAAVHMLYAGMYAHGVECISNIRARYDGERRNPWDEAECGHHYARAMAAWSGILALSGFLYHGARRTLSIHPNSPAALFTCFWSTASAWGTFTMDRRTPETRLTLALLYGRLRLLQANLPGKAGRSSAALNGSALAHESTPGGKGMTIRMREDIELKAGDKLYLAV